MKRILYYFHLFSMNAVHRLYIYVYAYICVPIDLLLQNHLEKFAFNCCDFCAILSFFLRRYFLSLFFKRQSMH